MNELTASNASSISRIPKCTRFWNSEMSPLVVYRCHPLRTDGENGERFCCEGCRSVHAIIQSHGMGRFYEFRKEGLWKGIKPRTRAKSYQELDDPTFQKKICKSEEHETF